MHTGIGIFSPDGQLLLREDPTLWIRSNPHLCQSVRRLSLEDRMGGGEKVIGDSIRELTKLTHLSIHGMDITHLPYKISSLRNLQILDLSWCCDKLQELPPNLGDLESLTSLSISDCTSLKFLPDSLAKLSKLTKLSIGGSEYLEELPANLGELKSLTQLSLWSCRSIKSLPDSVAELSKLTTLRIINLPNLRDLPNLGELKSLTHLSIQSCRSLKECPSNLNVVRLSLPYCCSIQSLPRGWSNLVHLVLTLCRDKAAEQILANLIYLRHLQVQNCLYHSSCVKELPANLDKLPQLSVLDIRESVIKCCPSSIMNLSQLRLLFLPNDFMLQTLPYQLHESLIITDGGIRVRKTWKELKKEMEIFTFPNVRVAPSEYLQLTVTEDSEQWFPNTCFSSMVRILDLKLKCDECGDNIIDLIAELPELTHLYICRGYFSHLPPTFAKLTHLSLWCEFKCDIYLGKLSTLEHLHLRGTELPAQMDLPVSLRHLTLHLEDDDPYEDEDENFGPLPDSMTKLSNLKVLHLIGGIQLDILPGNLNPEKLKLEDCDMTNIKSLPEGLKHVEIIHTSRFCKCYKLGICLNQLVYVETLSVTCHGIKFLPSIVGLHNLQELQLKDCFSIKKLPPNLDLMVNLHTINVSGTRIKSLPSSISNLPKFQCLILPKCFQIENLPLELRDRSAFDDTDDEYYKDMGYYDSVHETSSEDDDNTTNTIAGISKSQQQISPHQLLYQPDVTPVLGDSHGSIESEQLTADNRLLKIQNPCFPSSQLALHPEHGLPSNFQHNFSSGTGKNLLVSENGQNEDNMLGEGYNFLGKDHNPVSHHSIHHLRNQEMPKNIRVNEEVSKESEEAIIAEQQQTSPQQLLSLPADALSDSNYNGSHSKDMDILSPGILEEIITESFSFGRNSQHAVQNGQVDITNSDTGHEITFLKQGNSSCNQKDVSLIENNLDALENRQIEINSENEDKKGKRKRNEITREEIQSQFGKKQKDAAIELGVGLSTFKRRCRELRIKAWPSSRMSRRNKRKASSKLPCKSEYSQHVVECLDGINQHVLSNHVPDHVPSGHNVVDNSTLVAAQQHRDSDQRVQQHLDGTSLGTSTVVQPNECSRTIVVKATYKDDQVKVYFSLSSSVELLKEKIGKKLKLEVDKFKMKYQDEDKDLLLVADISDLEDALRVSESSGSNVIRLCIVA